MDWIPIVQSDDLEQFKNKIIDKDFNIIISHINDSIQFPSFHLLENSPPIISIASYFGAMKIVDYLIKNGAQLSISDSSDPPLFPIDFAIAGGHQNIVSKFLELNSPAASVLSSCVIFDQYHFLVFYLSLNLPGINQALITAVHKQKSQYINLILRCGAHYDNHLISYCQENNYGEGLNLLHSHPELQVTNTEVHMSKLILSAASGDYEGVKKAISEANLSNDQNMRNMNQITSNGDTPLIKAASKGNIQILDLLLQQPGIQINFQNFGGKTALYSALKAKKTETSIFLIRKGADPTIKTNHGRNALHAAAKFASGELLDILLSNPYLHPNQQDNKGETCLHLAVYAKNVAAIHRFLEVPGIKFNIHNKGGRSAFDLAPRKFILPFRPKMNEIIENARAEIRKKKEMKRAQKAANKKAKMNDLKSSNEEENQNEEENIHEDNIDYD